MIRLFLHNKEVELDKSVSFAINKQFEDITSPTDIKNDWSKTVQIPFTQSNNKLFGELFNVDRLIVEGDNTLMGIYFDPYKKVDFRLQWGSSIIMQGYAKNINVVKESNGKGHYNITLNGELGKVFQEMKKITFDNTTEDTRYLIDGSKYASGLVNKELVKQCFESEQTTLNLYSNTDTEYSITDILGFVPNNSFVDGFDYKTYEYTDYRMKQFSTALGEILDTNGNPTFANDTGVEPSTAVGEGLLPRQVGEYRSYLQLPYIYWNKLFQIFTEKTKEVTGYDIDLHTSWFNELNPYWSKVVYMLSGFYEENKEESTFALIQTNKFFRGGLLPYTYDDTPAILSNYGFWTTIDGTEILDTNDDFFIEDNKEYTFTVNPLNLEIRALYGGRVKCIINPRQAFFIDLQFKHKYTGEIETVPLYCIVDNSVATSYSGYEMIRIGEFSVENLESNNWWVYRVDLPEIVRKHTFSIANEYRYFNVEYTIRQLDMKSNYQNYRFLETNEYGTADTSNPNTVFILNYDSGADTLKLEWLANTIRSKYYFTLNTLWNNEYNLFNEILKYCKQYRIGIFCDDINKRLIFKPISIYFNDYKVLDWTDKLDTNREYHIQPITFENKYLLFNYKDSDVSLLKDYKNRYGVNYGEYKLTTDYNFNSDTKDLLKDIHNSLVHTPNVLPYSTLLNCDLIYIIPNEIFVSNTDEKNNNVDIFGSFYFNCGLKEFDNELGPVYVSDDTEFQKSSNVFAYIRFNSSNRTQVTKYPYLDNVLNGNLLYYSKPYVNYTINKESYSKSIGIYENFWKAYLNERYNKQNKIVTCYLRLTPYDIANFEYNNFIKINSQLYMVNKIYDYQIDENVTTKVDLITIQDVKGYTDNSYKIFTVYNDKKQVWDYYRDYITLKSVGENKTIYITSNTPIKWSNPNNALQSLLVYYNSDVSTATSGSGTIPAGELVPVTFLMNEAEDEFGDVIFTNGTDEVKVSVALIDEEVFNIYRKNSNGEFVEWDSTSDYIEFRDKYEEYTLYISSDQQVTWNDTEAALQDVYIDGVNGSGSIPMGDLVPVKFTIREFRDLEGNITFTNGEKDVNVFVRIFVDRSFKVYDTDKTLWTSTDKVELENTTPLSKTIYITSINSSVKWEASSNLIDMGVCANGDNTDWGEYEFGSGYIPAGSMIPVTFRIDSVGDVNTINGTIKLSTPQQTTTINVSLIYWEIFKLYRWDGTLWDEENDYILLDNSTPSKILYLTSNSDVNWYDDSGELQNLGIYTGEDPGDYYDYDYGMGTIPKPSNMKPVYFRLNPEGQELGSVGNIIFDNGRHYYTIPVRLA